MENYYTISRQIIGILSVLLSILALINEDISVIIVVITLVFIIALTASFFTTPISKRIIKIGDVIANQYLRILFYFAILPLTLFVAYIIYMLIMFVYNQMPISIEAAAITIISYISTTIIVIVPYIQTLIVLMLRVILKENKQ